VGGVASLDRGEQAAADNGWLADCGERAAGSGHWPAHTGGEAALKSGRRGRRSSGPRRMAAEGGASTDAKRPEEALTVVACASGARTGRQRHGRWVVARPGWWRGAAGAQQEDGLRRRRWCAVEDGSGGRRQHKDK
jgi:hypothetical protein